jgi:hypothetical protein
MGWQVHGTEVWFSASKDGLVIHGEGKQFYVATHVPGVDTSNIKFLTGTWSAYRASRSYETALLVGKCAVDMQCHLDPDFVKTTRSPISVIRYHHPTSSEYEASVGFATFLPDEQFQDFWNLVKLLALGAPMKYWLNYGCLGFLPRRPDQNLLSPRELANPALVPLAYPDWLAGTPYVSKTFSLRLTARESAGQL